MKAPLFWMMTAWTGLVLSLPPQQESPPVQYEYAHLVLAECEQGKTFSKKDPIRWGLCGSLLYGTGKFINLEDSAGKLILFKQPIYALNHLLERHPEWELVNEDWRSEKFNFSFQSAWLNDDKKNANGQLVSQPVFLLRRVHRAER